MSQVTAGSARRGDFDGLRGPGTATSAGSPFVAHDPAFAAVVGERPRLEFVVATDAHEGPVYVAAEDALYFTTLPQPTTTPAPGFLFVAVKRVALDGTRFPVAPDAVTVVAAPANNANGMALGPDGSLVVCEQGDRAHPAAITRRDRTTGTPHTIVDRWGGLPLNSPNDVVVASDGAIWFTDPGYGHLQGFRPEPALGDFVYRYDPASNRMTVVADAFDKPNGLAFSPDESVLYVTDSGANQRPGSYHVDRPHHIVAYDVAGGRRLRNPRLFAVTTPGFPDGIKVDADGRVYTSSFGGVQVFDPSGDLLGEILVPGAVNFCFGGPGRNVLFITTDTAVWAAVLQATGKADQGA